MRYKMIKIIAHIILEKFFKMGRKIIPVVIVACTIFPRRSVLNYTLNKSLSYLRKSKKETKKKVQFVNGIYNVSDIKIATYLVEDHDVSYTV